jgi:outer membrane biosynthesis protein TonB
MFAQLNPATGRRQRWLLLGSVVMHCVVLAFMLRAPVALRLQPHTLLVGENGTSVTRLYWSSTHPDNSTQSSSDKATQRYRHERLGHNALTYQRPPIIAKAAPVNPLARAAAQDDSKTQTLSAVGHGAQAGARYGSMFRGDFYGDEVRPAIPSVTSDPVVYPWQLPDVAGNEVIEVTINERGEIVDKKVLASLGPDIDTKCLAALESWRFHPATRNGAPIPSKQDAIFPFKARG